MEEKHFHFPLVFLKGKITCMLVPIYVFPQALSCLNERAIKTAY